MKINPDTLVGEIVKANYKTAQVFDNKKIDFCCGGGMTLSESCEKSNIDINQLVPELEALVNQSDPDSKYIDNLQLNELCDYIEKRHHSYVSESIPFIQQKLQKLCDVHGDNHPELFEIKTLFNSAAENLSAHMKKEEIILFPYISNMIRHKSEELDAQNKFGELQKHIYLLDKEHKTEGERFERISMLTSSYTCPPDGCVTFQICYQTLQDFEKDLHRHIHLENNVLFRKAIVLENELQYN